MKSLTLRNRMNGNWHDVAILLNALESLAARKSFAKAAMWMNLAGRAQVLIDEQDSADKLGNLTLELSNGEAKSLGKELMKLPIESFGRDARTGAVSAPPLGTLQLMMEDWSAQLGFDLPEPEDDEDDEAE